MNKNLCLRERNSKDVSNVVFRETRICFETMEVILYVQLTHACSQHKYSYTPQVPVRWKLFIDLEACAMQSR